MSKHLTKGDRVRWTWGENEAEGTIRERFTRRVSRTIKGTKVIRKGSEEEPAYLIVQDDGDKVLKSSSDLSKSG